jgi:hypothetical protein
MIAQTPGDAAQMKAILYSILISRTGGFVSATHIYIEEMKHFFPTLLNTVK